MQSQDIAYLSLPHFTVLDDSLLDELLQKNGKMLKALALVGCTNITPKPIVKYSADLKELEELSFTNQNLSDFVIRSWFAKDQSVLLPKLIKLQIENPKQDRSKPQPILAVHAPALQYLKIVGKSMQVKLEGNPRLKLFECHALSDLSYLKTLTSLEELKIDDCPLLTNQDLEQLLTNNLALRRLSIRRCRQIHKMPIHQNLQTLNVDGTFITAIEGGYPALKTIQANSCLKLTSIDLQSPLLEILEANNCPILKQVEVGSKVMKKLDLAKSPLANVNFLAYPLLEYLNLSSNKIVTIENLTKMPEALLYLKELSLNRFFFRSLKDFSIKDPFKNLVKLDLEDLSLSTTALNGPKLRELNLKGNSVSTICIAAPQLERIDLSENRLDHNSTFQLLGTLPPSWKKIFSITLEERDDVEELAQKCRLLGNIQVILNCKCKLDKLLLILKNFSNIDYGIKAKPFVRNTEEVKKLAAVLSQSSITQLGLGLNQIGEEGVKALAAALPQSSITQLDLRDTKIGVEGAKALAAALPQSSITQLYLSYNKIGVEGAKALAAALPQSSMTQLNLVWNQIGVEGAKALAAALPQSSMTQLNLWDNEIGVEGAKTLAAALPQSSITQLELGNNQIGYEGAKALAAVLPQSSMTQLNLWDNEIGVEGAKTLAAALPQSTITQLGLWDNEIGDEGAKALAAALPQSTITQLSLWRNKIGDEGAQALAAALPQSSITKLDLQSNLIGDKGKQALRLIMKQYPHISIEL